MNFFRRRKGNVRPHTVPVPTQQVLDCATDILPETVDQGVHRFVVTTETGNVETMYEAVLFINDSLIEGARRSRHRQAAEHAATLAALAGGGGGSGGVGPHRPLPIAPMPEQWLAALDTLSVAAVPIALRSLQDLYRGSTRENWTATTQKCAVALANLIFFVLVAYRRLDLASRPSKTLDRFGVDSSTAASNSGRACAKANDKTQRQLRAISDNIKASLSEYFSFLVWNAAEQVRQVTELCLVAITGHPDFHELPSIASYLSPHDCFIWLLVASVLHGASNKAPAATAGVPPPPGAVTPSTSQGSPGRRTSHSAGSDTPGTSSNTAAAERTHGGQVHSQSTSGDAGDSSPPPLSAVPAGAEPSATPLGWLTQILLTWNANGDGALFTQHFVEVILRCLNLYFKAWLQRRTHVHQLVDAWSVRDVVFPSSPVNVEVLVQELTAADPPATEDISTMIQVVTEMVVHASFAFYENTRCLVQMLYLLGPLNTVHFLCAISGVESAQSTVSSVRARDSRGEPATLQVADVWRNGVSMLMEYFAEYVLEPGISNGNDVPVALVVTPPPEVSTLLLQLTMIHIASESCTYAWTEQGRNSVGNVYASTAAATASAATTTTARRQQLRSWSTWISMARSTVMRQFSRTAPPQPPEPLDATDQERLDSIFAQIFCLAFEDLYALAMAVHRRDTTALLDVKYRRVLFTAFSRIKAFMTRLHEEHALDDVRNNDHAVAAMSESSFNAVNEVLDKYVTALRVAPTHNTISTPPNHRAYWLLAVSYLRLSGLQVPGEEPLAISLNYSCSTPGGSLKHLRDRSYECYEDWVVKHQETSWVPDECACNLERYSHELQPTLCVAHDRLLYCAMRFLCVAVKAAREEEQLRRTAGLAAGGPGSQHGYPNMNHIPVGESQAEVYLGAFTRFLLMMNTLSCTSLCSFLRMAHSMLRSREDLEGLTAASNSHSAANPLDGDGRRGLIDSHALHEASLFAIDTSLFFL